MAGLESLTDRLGTVPDTTDMVERVMGRAEFLPIGGQFLLTRRGASVGTARMTKSNTICDNSVDVDCQEAVLGSVAHNTHQEE